MAKRIDFTNSTINEWTVLEYIGDGKWRCKCSCGTVKDLPGYLLRKGKTRNCGHDYTNKFIDLSGETIGEWYVHEYIGNGQFKCECSCGTIKNIYGQHLRKGTSLSCGHSTTAFKDITHQTFGEIKVLKYVGNRMYEVQCSCGKIYNVDGRSLRTGHTTSCGHATNAKKSILGQTFGKWYVHEYVDVPTELKTGSKTYVRCECECGRTKILDAQMLRIGNTTSCGQCNRTDVQIDMTSSKEKFNAALLRETLRLNRLLTLSDIRSLVGLSESRCKNLISMYNSQPYLEHTSTASDFEKEIKNFILGLGLYPVEGDRSVLNGKELDIYLPDSNFAIEANGSYWHDVNHKDKTYHFNKTKLCEEKGIRLIHIFEHEWKNEITQQKLKHLIKQALDIEQKVVYARETEVRLVDSAESTTFLNKYHLQNSTKHEVAYGLYYNNELIEVMTFGASRFSNDYDCEIHRLCSKADYKIVGGASKLFKHFLTDHTDASIVSYCDISKFSGAVYEQLGMALDGHTSINYTYVNTATLHTLNRLQCTKQKLVAEGYDENLTEEEIMSQRGYTKIYGCGNKRYVYRPTC